MQALGPHGLAVVIDLLDAAALGSGSIHIVVTDRAEAVAAELERRCPAERTLAPLLNPARDELSSIVRAPTSTQGLLLVTTIEPGRPHERAALLVLNDQREWLLRRGVCAVVIVAGNDADTAESAYLELQAQAPDFWSVRSQVHWAVGPDLELTMRSELLEMAAPQFGGDRAAALRWLHGRALLDEWIEHRLWRRGAQRDAWLAEAATHVAGVATTPSFPIDLPAELPRLPKPPAPDVIAADRWPRPTWPSGQLDEIQQVLMRALDGALARDGKAELRILPEDSTTSVLADVVLTVGLVHASNYEIVLHLDAREGLAKAIARCLQMAGDPYEPLELLRGAARLQAAMGDQRCLLLITDANTTELMLLGMVTSELPIVASAHGEFMFTFCVAASQTHEQQAQWTKHELSSPVAQALVQWVRRETAALDLRSAVGAARHVIALIDASWGAVPAAAWQSLGPAIRRVTAVELTPATLNVALRWAGRLGPGEDDARTQLRSLAHSLADVTIAEHPSDPREPAQVATREAVALYRELAPTSPDVFLPNLAISLAALGQIQRDLGAAHESLASLTEAMRILLPFHLARPTAFEPTFMALAAELRTTCASTGLPIPDDLREWI